MQKRELSVIVPVYNEKENLRPLLKEIKTSLKDINHEIIIIDDNSPDKSFEESKKLSSEFPIITIRRHKKLGLASAILTGFFNSNADIVAVIDADLQHEPSVLYSMFNAIKDDKTDIIIGSRYIKGNIDKKWTKRRRLNSYVATFLAKPLVPRVTDPMAGIFMCKKSIIESIKDWKPYGYKLLLELLVKAKKARISEIPLSFRIRKNGDSKMGVFEIMYYLRLLLHLYRVKYL